MDDGLVRTERCHPVFRDDRRGSHRKYGAGRKRKEERRTRGRGKNRRAEFHLEASVPRTLPDAVPGAEQ